MATILVTGAAGRLGRKVASQLLAAGTAKVIVGSRDTGKLADLVAKGAEARKVDFDDAASLATAFAGVDSALIISTDTMGEPGRRLAQHKAGINAAAKAGATHIVYTSMPNPEPGKNAITFSPDHLGSEEALKATGVRYTILRNGWYMENLFLSYPSALASGTLYTSAGDGKIAHVAHDDVAEVTAKVLLNPPDGSQTLTLTGGTARTTAEIVALVAKATGKPLAVVNVTDEQLTQGMIAHGVPAFVAPTFTSFDTNTRIGGIDMVTDVVETITGHKPVTLEAFLAANAAALVAASGSAGGH